MFVRTLSQALIRPDHLSLSVRIMRIKYYLTYIYTHTHSLTRSSISLRPFTAPVLRSSEVSADRVYIDVIIQFLIDWGSKFRLYESVVKVMLFWRPKQIQELAVLTTTTTKTTREHLYFEKKSIYGAD